MTSTSDASSGAPSPVEFRPLSPEQVRLFESNPNPVLVLDAQFRIRYVNAALASYGEVDPSSLIGENIWTRYPEFRDSIYARAYEGVMRDGVPKAFENRHATRERWSAVYAYPADGGVVAILRNVWDERQAERALVSSEEALARAQSLAAIGSWSYSLADGLQLSAEAYRLLGLDPTIMPASVEAIRGRLQPEHLLQLSRALALGRSGDDIKQTVLFTRFDGSLVWFDVLVRVTRLDPNGGVQLHGTIQDVSARVAANEALRRSEKTLRLAQEAANIGSFDRDLRTGDTRWSEQLVRIVGLDPATFDQSRINRDPAYTFIHPDDKQLVRRALRAAIKTFDKQVIRHRIIRRDGEVRHLLGSAMVVRDAHGVPARLVGTAIDITDQVAADEQRQRLEAQIQQAQKLESLGILAGGIAHDFNNLLVGILGNASLALLDVERSHSAHESLVEIERAAQRAADLTRQLLAYAGKGRFIVEPVDASAVVHEMSALLRTAISRSASIQLDLATDLPAIEVDATQFRQVVMNLITNASDALSESGGLISLRTGVRELNATALESYVPGTNAEPGRFVFVEVNDTGMGMDSVTLARIFDPFFSTKFTGRGLGLAATLGIMRSHSGAIRVYSEVGKGTSFSLLFPAKRSRPRLTPTRADLVWSTDVEALVVDDDPSVRLVTSMLLERRGFRVTKAEDGAQAVELFRANPARFAIVLLDLTMPGMDGEATFRALREIRDDVHVLLMSGYNEQEVTRLFLGRGLAGFLQKPFRAEDLFEKVALTLGIVGDQSR